MLNMIEGEIEIAKLSLTDVIMTTTTNITPYQDINAVLQQLSTGIEQILNNDLVGLYLFGSLAYGDFNEGSSDIDLVAIVKKPLGTHQLHSIKFLHETVGESHKKWHGRIECSYTPIYMLANTLPPQEPRPYYGAGIFYANADYGNEWIINNYLLRDSSIPLLGPNFTTLIPPIDIREVQKACIRDLFQEWEPKIYDLEWLDNSHYQSYLVLNLCRILYTVYCGKTGTKKISAKWVKEIFAPQWTTLITAAENWTYDKEMSLKMELIEFIKFVINEIKQTALFSEMKLPMSRVIG